MTVKEITKGIYYAGVNDRTTEKFESLWPLPYGVSYNSYIVRGDKTALIDTVHIDESRDYLTNISDVIGEEPIDYLVINHMEPDHSGSIPEILERYPDLKILANRQAINMVKGFYHVTDDSRFVEVKEGTEVNLGGMTLVFCMTPMVHWPETMMTYVPERKLLFSGDAFGTFGALQGGVIDSQCETDMHIAEMYRYYSNIVGKYGKFVQSALAKLKGVDIEYICPTHGPVWHERLAEVAAIVDRLSRYESEEGVVIVYGSMYGNTAELANKIADALARRGVKNIKVHNASRSSMSDMISDCYRYRTLIIGCATYSMRIFPPVEMLMNALETREIKNKVFATFCGFTWAPSVVNKLLKGYTDRLGIETVAQVEMKQSVSADTEAQVEQLADAVVCRLGAE